MNVKEAELMALGSIQSIEDLTINLEKGVYTGHLYSKLIDADPINLALQSINDYQKIAKASNTPIEKYITKGMKNAENKLINTLITLAKNGDKEAITVIEQIVKINNYGLQAFNRMQELKTAINLQEEFSITATTNVPDEILINIFSECGIKELGRLMLSSKLFYKNANNNQIWKSICLKEDPTICNKENLNWKQLYFNEVDLNKYFNTEGNKIFIQNSKSTCYHLPPLKLIPGTITGKIFKKIVIKSLKLNCRLDEMRLIAGSNVIRDNTDSLNIKSYLEKSKYQVKIDIKVDSVTYK